MRRPLVAVARPGTSDDPLAVALAAGGADVLWLPTTRILPPLDPAPLAEAVARLGDVDWLVLTSGHAAGALGSRPGWASLWTTPSGKRPRVAAVGERTAERLVHQGVSVDLVPRAPGAKGLVDSLVEVEGGSLAGRRVLWPRSEIARPDLRDGLVAAGAEVLDPVAYRTVAALPEDLEAFRAALAEGRMDAVCFLSPSAAEGLVRALGAEDLASLEGRCLVASLGPTTTAALARLGALPDVEARTPSAEALAEAVLTRLSTSHGASP